MDEVRRERAVELAFEGHRFNDLRRWKLLTVYPYNIKTMQKFDRVRAFIPVTHNDSIAVTQDLMLRQIQRRMPSLTSRRR